MAISTLEPVVFQSHKVTTFQPSLLLFNMYLYIYICIYTFICVLQYIHTS